MSLDVFLWHSSAYPYVRAVSCRELFSSLVMEAVRDWAFREYVRAPGTRRVRRAKFSHALV